MNSTPVGIIGIPATLVVLLLILSLSLSLTSYVLYRHFRLLERAAIINLLGGVLMIVVLVSLITDGQLWHNIVIAMFFLVFILTVPTWLNFTEINSLRQKGAKE